MFTRLARGEIRPPVVADLQGRAVFRAVPTLPLGVAVEVMPACPVTLIEAAGLRKVFRKPDKDLGIRGSLKHLVKPRFSEHVAVDGIDLSVAEGEAVAYVGPNGYESSGH